MAEGSFSKEQKKQAALDQEAPSIPLTRRTDNAHEPLPLTRRQDNDHAPISLTQRKNAPSPLPDLEFGENDELLEDLDSNDLSAIDELDAIPMPPPVPARNEQTKNPAQKDLGSDFDEALSGMRDIRKVPPPHPKERRPGAAIELTGNELTELSTQEARQNFLKEAKALAADFPGLVLESEERQTRASMLSKRIPALDELLQTLKKDKREYLSIRSKTGTDKISLRGTKSTGAGLLLDEDIHKTQIEQAKNTKEYARLTTFDTADEDISDRLHALDEAREKSANNPITLSGLNNKVNKLQRIQELWRDAQTWESEADRLRREKTEASYDTVQKGLLRIKKHEKFSKLRAKPSNESRKPKVDIEAIMEEGLPARLEEQNQNEARAIKEDKDREARLIEDAKKREAQLKIAQAEAKRQEKIHFYEEKVSEQFAELEHIANELKQRFGKVVELPDPTGKRREIIKDIPGLMKEVTKPSIFSRAVNFLVTAFQDPEKTKLLEKFEEGKEEYQTRLESFRSVKANLPARRPSALRSAR